MRRKIQTSRFDMSKTYCIGKPCVFGMVEPKPLRGFPQGRARLKLRNLEFARVFVRDAAAGTIRAFLIHESPDGCYWEPGYEQGMNRRLVLA